MGGEKTDIEHIQVYVTCVYEKKILVQTFLICIATKCALFRHVEECQEANSEIKARGENICTDGGGEKRKEKKGID